MLVPVTITLAAFTGTVVRMLLLLTAIVKGAVGTVAEFIWVFADGVSDNEKTSL